MNKAVEKKIACELFSWSLPFSPYRFSSLFVTFSCKVLEELGDQLYLLCLYMLCSRGIIPSSFRASPLSLNVAKTAEVAFLSCLHFSLVHQIFSFWMQACV